MWKNRMQLVLFAIIIIIGGSVVFKIVAKPSDKEDNRSMKTSDQAQKEIVIVKKPNENEVGIKERSNASVQSISIGAVDIEVQFYNEEIPSLEDWIFMIDMDTHSVDLDQIDLEKSVYFMDDNGNIINEGFKARKSGSGHHISQYIELPKQINGEETIKSDFTSFKMVFLNIDGVEKSELEWDMTLFADAF